MELQKINVKIMADKGRDLPLKSFINVFHRVIQDSKLEGLLIDVAEYTHVHEGPGVLLIGHEANISVDEEGGKRGLLYNQKRAGEKDPGAHLKQALDRALKACATLEKDKDLAGKLSFDAGHLEIFVNDRLAAPNDEKNRKELESVLKAFLAKAYPGISFAFTPERDPARRLGFTLKSPKPLALSEALAKAGAV